MTRPELHFPVDLELTGPLSHESARRTCLDLLGDLKATQSALLLQLHEAVARARKVRDFRYLRRLLLAGSALSKQNLALHRARTRIGAAVDPASLSMPLLRLVQEAETEFNRIRDTEGLLRGCSRVDDVFRRLTSAVKAA